MTKKHLHNGVLFFYISNIISHILTQTYREVCVVSAAVRSMIHCLDVRKAGELYSEYLIVLNQDDKPVCET